MKELVSTQELSEAVKNGVEEFSVAGILRDEFGKFIQKSFTQNLVISPTELSIILNSIIIAYAIYKNYDIIFSKGKIIFRRKKTV